MGGATDARIVITNDMLGMQGSFFFGQLDQLGTEPLQIIFHLLLVLASGRSNDCMAYQTLVVRFIAMIQNSARRLGDGLADAGAWLKINRGLAGWLVIRQDLQSFLDSQQNFQGPDHDSGEGISVGEWYAGGLGGVANQGRGQIGIQVPACQRSNKISAVNLTTPP